MTAAELLRLIQAFCRFCNKTDDNARDDEAVEMCDETYCPLHCVRGGVERDT